MSHGELFARPAWKCLQELFGGRQVPPRTASGIPQADFGEAMEFWKTGKPENVFQKHLKKSGNLDMSRLQYESQKFEAHAFNQSDLFRAH